MEVDDEHLPDEVLTDFLRQLMNAGGDTTYRGTGVLLTCLLNHPDQMEAVRANRELARRRSRKRCAGTSLLHQPFVSL
ncbi:cytochrome P450 [Novosphingobium sp. ERN07]|uniref:cytochrome P450 n=1 Tax=Novosphingobium sp. ERN07 TaxID=2726187 RepID=UPI001F10251E|nr:cytochrome P450 [Novosphingobium sp. ERN07]